MLKAVQNDFECCQFYFGLKLSH